MSHAWGAEWQPVQECGTSLLKTPTFSTLAILWWGEMIKDNIVSFVCPPNPHKRFFPIRWEKVYLMKIPDDVKPKWWITNQLDFVSSPILSSYFLFQGKFHSTPLTYPLNVMWALSTVPTTPLWSLLSLGRYFSRCVPRNTSFTVPHIHLINNYLWSTCHVSKLGFTGLEAYTNHEDPLQGKGHTAVSSKLGRGLGRSRQALAPLLHMLSPLPAGPALGCE